MSNICEQCGGVKTFSIEIQPVYSYANDGTKEMLPASIPFKICMCPLPREKHDGKLDDYSVSFSEIISVYGPTEGVRIKCHGGPEQADLTYGQALSLLAWLRQEEATLEQLVAGQVKEQAE